MERLLRWQHVSLGWLMLVADLVPGRQVAQSEAVFRIGVRPSTPYEVRRSMLCGLAQVGGLEAMLEGADDSRARGILLLAEVSDARITRVVLSRIPAPFR